MSFKKVLMTASALALLGGSAFADGGPVPEPAAPPPEPVAPPPEPAPAPAPAPAPFDHWYLDAHGGVVWLNDMDFTQPPGPPFVANMDTGWGLGGAIGYRWESGWRGELEATWRWNDGGTPGIQRIPTDIGIDSVSVMVNALYDIDMGTFFVPYIGAGIGGSRVTAEITPPGVNDDGWAFAYQFLGGISVPLPNTALELFADYRFLSTAGLTLDFGGVFDDNDEYRTHNVMGGIRFNF